MTPFLTHVVDARRDEGKAAVENDDARKFIGVNPPLLAMLAAALVEPLPIEKSP